LIRPAPELQSFALRGATALIAGVKTSHEPMVTTMAVRYPKGLTPTLRLTMPANSISSQALTKKNGPADESLKNFLILISFGSQ